MNYTVTRLLLVIGLIVSNVAAVIPCQEAFGESVPTKQVKTNTNLVIAEDDNFKFMIQSCLRKGQTVSCEVLITNPSSEDKTITVRAGQVWGNGAHPRIIDIEGNEYYPDTIAIGQSVASRDGGSLGSTLEKRFLRGIPTKVNFTFSVP